MAKQMAAAAGVDTEYGGIGYHGDVAFNDPPISRWFRIWAEEMRQSTTRVVALGDDSMVVQSIGCAVGPPELIPPMGVTIGMRAILSAWKLRFYLDGGEPRRATFRNTLPGEPSAFYPSTLLQGHPDCIVHTDEAKARPIIPSFILMPPLRFGLAGYGAWGKYHAQVIQSTPECQLTAVCLGTSASRDAAAKETGAQVFSSPEELLAAADVDVIDIVAPNYVHEELSCTRRPFAAAFNLL